MIETAYHGYTIALPWVVAVGAMLSVYKRNWTLLRCVAIVGLGQAAIDIWFANIAPAKFAGQPYMLSAIIYFVSALCASLRPSGKLCSTLGGVFMAGFVFSCIAMVFEYTTERDYMFWGANVLLGIAQLAVISGGATGERGRRFCIALGRAIAGMVNRKVPSRLA